MLDMLIRYLHFLGILILMATLVAEYMLLAPHLNKMQLKKLARIDSLYGASAGLVLVAGLLLWFVVGKPSEIYSDNWVFHLKIMLFILVGLLSIVPTVFFVREGRRVKSLPDDMQVAVPNKVIAIVRVQLAIIVVMPLLAVLMAHGVGL